LVESAILVGNTVLDELRELAVSAGARIVGEMVQRRTRPDPATYIGKGKTEELREAVLTEGADVVIFDDDLSPSQARNLEESLEAKVVDRTGLILDIFARRARTKEGQLQVELAQLNYRLTRLSGYSDYLSRLGGGIGTRGPGET
jgi:GTP-binding protein HflX